MSDSDGHEEEPINESEEEKEETESTVSSYASPKDHISETSGYSEQRYLPAVIAESDAPTVERLEREDDYRDRSSEEHNEPVHSRSSSQNGELRDSNSQKEVSVSGFRENDGEIEWGIPQMERSSDGDESPDDPSGSEEMSYEHRPKESAPTRKILSQAARELAVEGVPKANRTLARSLSGLTAEVLGDEGRANSPLDDESWRKQEKHFFIFSSAGKPIYSRHGDEGALCGMMAILEAIHSVVQSKGEEPICIQDGPVKIVYLSKEPIVLVGVSRRKESIKWILRQLEYLYNHVLCLATGALVNVLKSNPGQDVRNLLKGSSQVTEGFILDFGNNPGLFLEAFFPVRMLKNVRQNAISALTEAAKSCQARASFLLFDSQVVCMTQETNNQIEILDLMLLLNFVLNNELYRSQAAVEFNAPICMPHLHETAFLHAYIYFLEKDPDLVVVLLMTQPDTFHSASEARKTMEKKLRELGVVHSLRTRKMGNRIYNRGQVQMEELPLAAGGGKREVTAVQTFIFLRKSPHCPQYILCRPSKQTRLESEWKYLVTFLAGMHSEFAFDKRGTTQKVHWHMDSQRSILYENTSEGELYLVCDPLTLQEHATRIGRQIVRFLLSEQVKEELFILPGEK